MSNSINTANTSTNGETDGEKIPQKSRSVIKITRQIMNRHIRDKDDVITEEEFRNLQIEIETTRLNDTSEEPLEIEEDKRPKDEDKDPTIITP